MNKKVLTLCAGLLLAGSATAWGQVTIDKNVFSGNGAYKVQESGYVKLNQYVQENASSRGDNKFPTVSPFAIQTKYGAKPIDALQHVDGQSDGRYFQFVVGNVEGAKDISGRATGTEVLTMVWVNQKGELEDNKNSDSDAESYKQGHYEIQLENVNNANVPNNRITLDRTLWKVTANREGGTGTTLYYTLQNKASEMILQLSADKKNIIQESGDKKLSEIKLEITSGQTKWRWAEGQVASETSNIENETRNNVLKELLSAQPDDQRTIYLARKVASDGTVTLGAIMMNSNVKFDGEETIGEDKFYPITFEAWEANPIILTADQINAELGNEVQLTSDKKTEGYFHFEFENDVEGGVNVMKASDFTAIGPKAGFDRVPGDTPDGYVRFAKKGTTDTFLRVDTAYHDAAANSQYSLKLTVDKITWVREAVQKDGATVDSNGIVTGVSEGSVSIIVTDKISGRTTSYTINVEE